MRPQANFTRQLAVIAVFAVSCVGILIYLWTAFGGSIPLQPKRYEVVADFPNATNLGLNADVRISGVNVGHVVAKSSHGDYTRVTFNLQRQYAPLPVDVHAMLRQKTLLGETYVDLAPGDARKAKLPEGGHIAQAQVSAGVTLDEIFRAFNPRTRAALQTWFQQQAAGLQGRGHDLNDALGNAPAFAQDTDQLLAILNSQEGAVQRLVSNTGVVFGALSERRGQLSGSIRNWNTVMATLARRNKEIEGTFKALPTFEKEGSQAMQHLAAFGRDANPTITKLRPFARALGPTVRQVDGLAPDFDALMRNVAPLVKASRTGLPAGRRLLAQLQPTIGAFPPVLTNLNPVLGYIAAHRDDLMAFIVNVTAATEASSVPAGLNHAVHYLRAMTPLGPGALATYNQRQSWSRANPYALSELSSKSGFKVYDSRGCGETGWPTIAKTPVEGISLDFLDRIERYALNSGQRAAPPCVQEPRGKTTFDHVLPSHP
jgi:phospholipid/cholesterol/gamma-HCH transport system substrate-binding protein